MNADPVVAVPADLDVEDRLVGPITFRMAAWLAAAASGAGLAIVARGNVAALGVGGLLAVAGLVGAWWRPGGRAATAWLLPMWRYRRRHRAAARDGRRPVTSDEPIPMTASTPAASTSDPPPVRRSAAGNPSRAVGASAAVAGSRPNAWVALARTLLLPSVVAIAAIGAAVTGAVGGTVDRRPAPPRPALPLPASSPAQAGPDSASTPDTVVVVPLDPFWWEGLGGDGIDCLC